MKILFVSTAERSGGGAIAALRLLTALNRNGISATMVVRDKQSDLAEVIALKQKWAGRRKFLWERLVIWANNLFSRRNLFKVSIANTGFDITRLPEFQQADIIHLHWVSQGMLSLGDIKRIMDSGKPVVWTLHDMWQSTAICHHSYTCDRYKTECKQCPFLRFPGEHDLANRVFRKKMRLFRGHTINIVTVSRWQNQRVRESALLGHCPTHVIPNTLSLDDFQLMDKAECRRQLGLPADKQIVLFGAARVDDPIKGFPTVLEAIGLLLRQHPDHAGRLHLVTFGTFKQKQPPFPIAHTGMGWIKDNHTLSALYGAADVSVSASLYETFGQTLIEAQACGCLPVSFGNSGQADIIRHKQNGYLADYGSATALAEGMHWALTAGTGIPKEKLREDVVRRFSADVVAGQYRALYETILPQQNPV